MKFLQAIILLAILTSCGAGRSDIVTMQPTTHEGVFKVITDLGAGELTTRIVDGEKRFVIQNIYLRDYLTNTGEFLSEMEEMEDLDYRFEDGQVFIVLTLEQFDSLIKYIFWKKREAEIGGELEMQ